MSIGQGGQRHSFFIELILGILVFSLSCIIIISVFVKAHHLSEKAAALNFGNIQVQTIAEWIRGMETEENLEQTFLAYGALKEEEGYRFNYECYTLRITSTQEVGMTHYNLEFTREDSKEILINLKIDKYYRSSLKEPFK